MKSQLKIANKSIQVLSQGWVSEDLFCEVSVRNLVVHSNSDDVDDFLRTFREDSCTENFFSFSIDNSFEGTTKVTIT